MGGCCAPGTLGAERSAAMVAGNSSSSQQLKSGVSGDSSCGEFDELTGAEEEESLGAASLELSASQDKAVDVEKVLRVLEIAVEREYVDGLREDSNASNSQHQQNIASLRSSLAESTTSLFSIARSVFSENSNRSLGDRESWSLQKEKVSSKENHRLSKGKYRTGFNQARGVEANLESIHHLEKGDNSLELKQAATGNVIEDKTHGNFEKMLQQVLTFDSQGRTTQAKANSSLNQCRQPESLIDCDDYPRGTSDTNSEDAERDKKAICTTPMMNLICPTQQATLSSFISLGLLQCQPRETQAIPTSCIGEGSVRVEQSNCTSDSTRKITDQVCEPVSNSFHILDQEKIVVDDSYASWLDRHSKQLGSKNNSRYKRGDSNEQEKWAQDDWVIPNGESEVGLDGLNLLQRHDTNRYANGFQLDYSRSLKSQCGLPEFELHTRDSERTSVAHVKVEQSYKNKTTEIVDDFDTTCSTSSRIQGIPHQTSKVGSFQFGEHVKGSFRFSPNFHLLDDAPHAPLRSFQIPNSSYFDSRINLECQKDWARSELGNSGKPTDMSIAPLQVNSAKYISEYGGAKTLQTPRLMLENPSNGTHGGFGCSQLNSRVKTPKSVPCEGKSLATNVENKEKVRVCVRMRPFHDHEKVCPLRQVLCVLGKKVVVKEYGMRRSLDNNDTDLLEFRVDCVLDDSYLQAFRVEQKEESQRRMYESIGLPCLEYTLDGFNTTVIAYGQVNAGKTYTMMGDGTEEGKGLMPRLAKDLMNRLNSSFKGEFEVQVSYLEIYQEKIRDLLAVQKLEVQESRGGSMRSCAANFFFRCDESTYEHSVDYDTASNASFIGGTPRSWRTEHIPSVYFDSPTPKKEYLKVREHPVTGPYVEGLLWKTVTTWQDLETVMLQGAANRISAATPLNKLSSRGHTLFTIKLIRGGRRFVHGYPSPSFSLINLVDLAGTDKPQSAKKSSLERLEESRYINRSLAQLNDVILNLSRNKKFISYRSSTLTWLLRNSLSGNSKLFFIANISPAEQDFQESVNTLRHASRANRIHNLVSSDPDPKKQLIVRMKKEIQVLHNLVHDLTKNKIAECVNEELRHAQQPLPLKCQGPAFKPTGVHNLTKNKIAECVSKELRRAQRLLPLQSQSSDYGQCSTKNKIEECVPEEIRRTQQQLPLQCQASEYEPTGMYMETTNLPELFI